MSNYDPSPRKKRSFGSINRIAMILILLAAMFFGRDYLDLVNNALNPNSPPPAVSTSTSGSSRTSTSNSASSNAAGQTARASSNTQDCCLDLTTPKQRRHILTGDTGGGGHKCGMKRPGKSEFPCDWSDDQVINAISVIARDHAKSCRVQGNGNCVIDRDYKGERIRVVLGRDKRFIITGYPLNRPRNP